MRVVPGWFCDAVEPLLNISCILPALLLLLLLLLLTDMSLLAVIIVCG